jgi:hypothetical protein
MSVSSPRTGGPTLARVRGSSLGDARAVRLEALEVPYDVFCAGSGAERLTLAVSRAWEWCLVDGGAHGSNDAGSPPPGGLTVVLDDAAGAVSGADSRELSGSDLPAVMDRLTPMITGLALTDRRSDLVMFHACAVADPGTGAAVALYGPSGTGKTTLARALCTELVYLSDETAAVDDALRVVPYPKPLSVLPGAEPGRKDQVSPGDLGLVRPDGREYVLRGLVQLRRDPGHRGPALLEPLPTVDALPELVAQTSFTRDMDRPLHRLADLARQTGGVRRATYAEALDLRPLVRSILDGEA